MKKLSLLTYTCLWTILLAEATAAELTLEQCRQRAEEHNSGLKAFTMSKEAAVNSKDLNRAAFFPQLTMKAQYSLADQPGRMIVEKDDLGPGLPDQDVNLADDNRDNYQAGLKLTQPLFTGGNLSHSYARADYQLRSAESELHYQRDLLLQNVSKTFYEALAANIQLTSATKSLLARNTFLKIIKNRQTEGYATREDLLAAEAAVTETEARLVETQNRSELIFTNLRRLMNAPPDEPLKPVGELAKLRIDAPLSEFLANVDSSRHDVQAMTYQVRQSNEEVGIARSSLYPNFSLQGGYLRQRETNVANPDVWSVMLSADWNVFDWGKTDADIKRTAALNQRDSFRLEELRKEAMLEVEILWRKARTELSRLLNVEARVKAAELALEQSISRRQEGKARQVELLSNEALLWQEYGDYYQSAAELNGTIASLERAAATPLENFLIRSPLYKIDLSATAARVTAVSNIHRANTELAEQKTHLPGKGPTNQTYSKKDVKQSCRIQFGAFSLKDNAEFLLKSLNSHHTPGLQVSIVAENGLFKVVSGFFASRDEAIKTVQELGIKTYVIKT